MTIKKIPQKDDKTIISSEYYTNLKPEYLCSFCSQTLVRLTDAGQNNTTFFCRSCQVEYDPEAENLRPVTKITVPDRNTEPAVTSIQTNMEDSVTIRHTPEIRGGFAELQKKGIKIKDYHTTEKE